jgi:hypothetical protein
MNRISQFMALAQTLSLENIDRFVACYAQDCVFSDPFQSVRGQAEVRRVYLEMLQHLHQPRFRNVRILGGPMPEAGPPCEVMIGWDFEFSLAAGKPRTVIAGASLLRLNPQGNITEHRDYWDASRLMETFPVVGKAIGWLRRKIGQPDPT